MRHYQFAFYDLMTFLLVVIPPLQAVISLESVHPLLPLVLFLVFFPWVFGPLGIRFQQWSSACPCLVPHYLDDPQAPPLLRQAPLELKPLGFVHLRTFQLLNQVPNVTGFISLYFNPATLDIVRVIAASAGNRQVAYYVFTTELSDGNEICTSNNSLPIITPPVAGKVHNMAFPSIEGPAQLYAVHCARIKGRPRRRPDIDDPHAYVLGKETRALNHHVACGYYYRSENGRRLFPTWKGAILMTWKSLWPIPPIRLAWRRMVAWLALKRLAVEETGDLYDRDLDTVACP